MYQLDLFCPVKRNLSDHFFIESKFSFFYQPFFLSELLKIQNQNYEEKI
ncbi:hypothetical protein BpHYR1_046080 [Brachionus plicatilis]|uniref:Uncharacterized protein n=1 Tax=Brachionus plicatilis TaxID=10195 RepID=A0A3M7RTU1_BRAPC|nr:hypothetical protein BpHYR1_046080 [Brachionus plicatilis]